uniref:Uncharacterized protein n=1 Tax=Rhodnius prolixus TaxID=13249 RepID=T1I0K7_RHOPR
MDNISAAEEAATATRGSKPRKKTENTNSAKVPRRKRIRKHSSILENKLKKVQNSKCNVLLKFIVMYEVMNKKAKGVLTIVLDTRTSRAIHEPKQ